MKKLFGALLVGAFALCACDDDTANIGIDVMPSRDNVTASVQTYNLPTRTVAVDSVLANTATCYLGSVIDPELRVRTTSDFLAQFHVPDNFALPKLSTLVTDDAGNAVADSCDIRIYFTQYYGDSLASMKLHVQELDKANTLEENVAYYTNLNPSAYVNANSAFQKTVSYAVKDLTRPESETSGTKYYRQIVVKLPAQYGSEILQTYYQHPEYFANSYHFIHNVCPGFYFESAGGVGSMISSNMIALNVYFRYHTTDASGNDTIVDGMQRFGATEEVLQTTRTENDYPDSRREELLSDTTCTYVKTPTGFFTEMTLPLDSIFSETHRADSLDQAKLTLRKYNETSGAKFTLDTPKYLLLIRKGKMDNFFRTNQLPNSIDSYLSNQYSTSSPAYQFSNIAQLITDLRLERDNGAGITANDDEATRKQKYAAWEALPENADWNKLLLVPVAATYTTTTNVYGTASKTLQSVHHDLSLSSARLEGGTLQPIRIEVIYSRYTR